MGMAGRFAALAQGGAKSGSDGEMADRTSGVTGESGAGEKRRRSTH